jgi:hypothetical protein
VLQITATPLQNVATTVAEPLLSVTKSLHIPLQSVANIVATCCRVLQNPVQNGCRVSRKVMGSVEDCCKRHCSSVPEGCEIIAGCNAFVAKCCRGMRKSLQICCNNDCKLLQNVAQSAERFVEAFQSIQRQPPTEGLPVSFKRSSRERDIWTLFRHTPKCTARRLLTFKRTGTKSACWAPFKLLSRNLDSSSSSHWYRGRSKLTHHAGQHPQTRLLPNQKA